MKKFFMVLVGIANISNISAQDQQAILEIQAALDQDHQAVRAVQVEPAQILAQIANWEPVAQVVGDPFGVANVDLDNLRVRTLAVRDFINDYIIDQFDHPLVPDMPNRFVVNLNVLKALDAQEIIQSILAQIDQALDLQNNWQAGDDNPLVVLLGLDVFTWKVWDLLDDIAAHIPVQG